MRPFRIALFVFVVANIVVLALGCGPSDQSICDAHRNAPCPAGQINQVIALGDTECLHNLEAACKDQYRALAECETTAPICDVKNPDGSFTAVSAIGCGTERDAFLACAMNGG
jgi:hypothetical protein